jgi:hypothetical protein
MSLTKREAVENDTDNNDDEEPRLGFRNLIGFGFIFMKEEAMGLWFLVCTVRRQGNDDKSAGVACCMLSLASTAVGCGAVAVVCSQFLYA